MHAILCLYVCVHLMCTLYRQLSLSAFAPKSWLSLIEAQQLVWLNRLTPPRNGVCTPKYHVVMTLGCLHGSSQVSKCKQPTEIMNIMSLS